MVVSNRTRRCQLGVVIEPDTREPLNEGLEHLRREVARHVQAYSRCVNLLLNATFFSVLFRDDLKALVALGPGFKLLDLVVEDDAELFRVHHQSFGLEILRQPGAGAERTITAVKLVLTAGLTQAQTLTPGRLRAGRQVALVDLLGAGKPKPQRRHAVLDVFRKLVLVQTGLLQLPVFTKEGADVVLILEHLPGLGELGTLICRRELLVRRDGRLKALADVTNRRGLGDSLAARLVEREQLGHLHLLGEGIALCQLDEEILPAIRMLHVELEHLRRHLNHHVGFNRTLIDVASPGPDSSRIGLVGQVDPVGRWAGRLESLGLGDFPGGQIAGREVQGDRAIRVERHVQNRMVLFALGKLFLPIRGLDGELGRFNGHLDLPRRGIGKDAVLLFVLLRVRILLLGVFPRIGRDGAGTKLAPLHLLEDPLCIRLGTECFLDGLEEGPQLLHQSLEHPRRGLGGPEICEGISDSLLQHRLLVAAVELHVGVVPGHLPFLQRLSVYILLLQVLIDPLLLGLPLKRLPLGRGEEAKLLQGVDGLMPQGNDRICRVKCQTENLGGVLPLSLHVCHELEGHIPQSITRHYSLQSLAKRIDLGLDLSRHFLGRGSLSDRRLLRLFCNREQRQNIFIRYRRCRLNGLNLFLNNNRLGFDDFPNSFAYGI